MIAGEPMAMIGIDRAYVRDKIGELAQDADLSRFILNTA
jgi:ATP-dependent protease HslVU (ClpYQ) ATPase subunit